MTEQRWLTAEEQRTWRAYLAAGALLQENLNRRLQQDSGLPLTYYEILITLSETPDRMLRMTELAERCRASRSRLSHAVARLAEAGWVRRQECPTDKRGAFALLTDEGFAQLSEAAPQHVSAVREYLFDVLTPEQVGQFGEICAAIRDGFIERGLAAGCPSATLDDPGGGPADQPMQPGEAANTPG